jgi:hypothetical protein
MKSVSTRSVMVWAALALLGAGAGCPGLAAQEGVALAILYDTSGSMSDAVRDGAGKYSPKYKIANRALEAIAKQIQGYVAARPGQEAPRKVEAGLFTFNGNGVREVVPFGNFDAPAMIKWARNFSTPGSGTPIGTALEKASATVLKSDLSRKHVLIITDGMNTVGPDPAATLPGILKQAEQKQTKLGVYFVAFDVDARVFNPVKKLGAKIFGAGDEKQLNAQLQLILQQEILLEEPETPKKN